MTIKHLHFNSPAIVVLIIACWLIKILNDNTFVIVLSDGTLQKSLIDTYFTLRSPIDFGNWLSVLTLFSHALGHANDAHLYANLSVIFLAGPMIEERFGSIRLALAMVFVAGFTGLFTIVFVPFVALKGASGIAFMLFILASFANTKRGYVPVTFVLACSIYLQSELRFALMHDKVLEALGKPSNIAHYAHFIGGSIGAIIGMRYSNKVMYINENKKENLDI